MVWVEPRRGGARGRFEYLTFSGPPRQHAVLDFGELAETCALDVADRGRHDLEVVGRLINLTMQRTAQHEESALAEARALAEAEGWAEHVAPERLYRIQRAPAQRRSERAADAAGAAEATRAFLARGGRWTGRAPYDPLCPRCGRQVPWERMAKHEAPDGRRCNEARVARAARADPSSSAL